MVISLTRPEAGFHLLNHLIQGAKKPRLAARLEIVGGALARHVARKRATYSAAV